MTALSTASQRPASLRFASLHLASLHLASLRLALILIACLFGLAIAPAPAAAMTGLFYQPQLRDREVAAGNWTQIFAEVRRLGFDTLVIQWTRHGQAFSEGSERDWLAARIDQARGAGLRLVIGLAADPQFFERATQAGDGLDGYLRRLAADDAALARRWVRSLPADAIGGWYLPAEIDDLHWRDDSRARQLTNHLADSVARLATVLPRPVYISSFFTGRMHPRRFTDLMERVRRTGVQVWVQDGRGTGVLTEAETRLYLAPLLDCRQTPADAVIHELFVREPAADGVFVARGLGRARTAALLAGEPPCSGRRLFFSLRYLPGIDRLMGTPGAPSQEPVRHEAASLPVDVLDRRR